VGCLALAGVIALALYQVLRLSPLWPGLAEAREHALARHGLGEFLDRPGYWIERNWTQFRLAFRGYLTVPVIVAAAVGLGLTLRRSPRTGLYLLGWIALPLGGFVALAGEPFLRWLLVVVPPIAVLAGIGAVELVGWVAGAAERWGRTAARLVAVAACLVLVAPAIAWDARTIASPADRVYPSRDDVDLVQAYSAGGPWYAVVDELERVPGEVVVATAGNGLEYLFIALRDRPVSFVPADAGDPRPVLALRNTRDPLPSGPSPMAWRTLRTWERPRDGLPATLSERGVIVDGRFAASPDELAELLGGPAALDRFTAAHPPVARWLDAWETAYAPGS
jgi:hypothetical protein